MRYEEITISVRAAAVGAAGAWEKWLHGSLGHRVARRGLAATE